MKLDPKTFLAIDSSISAVINAAYEPVAAKLIDTLDPLIEAEKWASCHFAVDQLDLSGVVASCRPRLQELAVAALMFGAHKQSGDITATKYTASSIPPQMHIALDQMEHSIEQDAAQLLRTMLHDLIDEVSERVPLKKDDDYLDVLPGVGNGILRLLGPTGRQNYPAGYSFDRDYPGNATMYDNPRYQLQAGPGARPHMPNQAWESDVSGSEMLRGPSPVATSPNGYLVNLGPWEAGERGLGDIRHGERYGYDDDMGFYPDSLRSRRSTYLDPEDLRDSVPNYLARDPQSLRPNETIYPRGMPGNHPRSLFKADDGLEPCGCVQCNHLRKDELKKADKATYAYKLNQAVRGNAKALIDIGATMTTSRIINLGFLSQADSEGASSFVISAILDDRTCPVCQFMDGKVFSVDTALAHTMTALGASDPQDLKQAAPWPKQDKASLASLYGMTTAEIMANGWFCPFHPNCRCTPERIEDQAHLQGSPDNLTGLTDAQQGVEQATQPDYFVDPETLDAAYEAAVADAAKVVEKPPVKTIDVGIIEDEELRAKVEALPERDRDEIVQAYDDGDLDLLKDLLDTLGITYDEASLTPKE